MVLGAALSAALAGCAAPGFAPSARQSFAGFVALNPPRADVPVGAIWVSGSGAAGEGADPDNLETVRSVNGLAIDQNLQFSLSLGLTGLLGIDPKARDHYSARFSDLAIVRVKDLSRLKGPVSQPRIIEAVKAGSVTITSDRSVALAARSGPAASTANERTGTYSMEARDMFIAVRIATPKPAPVVPNGP
jgi:hypothetical protein